MTPQTPELSCTPRELSTPDLLDCITRLRAGCSQDEVQILVMMFARMLDIAAEMPGGWHALIHGLQMCENREDAAAFCRAFTSIAASQAVMDEVHAVHDEAG